MVHDAILAAALRARPRTVEELAPLVRLPLADTDREVQRLVRSGDVVIENGELRYPQVIERAATAVAALAERLRLESDQLAASLDEVARSLPPRARDWAIGERLDRAGMSIETFHGERAAEDLWLALSARRPPEAEACVVFPDMSPFETRDLGRAERFAGAIGDRSRVRAIMPTELRDERFATMAATYSAAGIQFRTLVRPPSWFWLDGDHVAMPFAWGDSWPSSVRLIEDGTLARLVRDYFEHLWGSAQDLSPAGPSWEPLLALMRQGRTLETASRVLGINPRTGRRRAAAAMEHYGVETLFALGAAWGEDTAAAGPQERPARAAPRATSPDAVRRVP